MIYEIKEDDIVVTPNCDLCHSGDRLIISHVFLQDRDFSFFETSCCRQCGFVYRSKKPSLEWFERQWHKRSDETTDSEELKQIKAEGNKRREKRYRNLEKLLAFTVGKEDKSLLDVGCGPGHGLHMFTTKNWEVVGLEPDPQRSCIGVKEWGLDIRTTTLEDFETDKRFSVVSFIQVLEHLQDPVECLKRASELVDDDGHIYVEVPFFDWFVDWRDSLYIEHVNNFNFDTLIFAGHLAGLRVVQPYYVRTHPTGAVQMAVLFKKESSKPPEVYHIDRQSYDFGEEKDEWWTIASIVRRESPMPVNSDLIGVHVSDPHLQKVVNTYRYAYKVCLLQNHAPIPQPLFGFTTINLEVENITDLANTVEEAHDGDWLRFAESLVALPHRLGERKFRIVPQKEPS